jgi:hypothetical protein
MKEWNNGQLRELSAEEIAVIEADRKAWNDAKPTRQLSEIRKIRNQKLSETDYLGVSDNTMSSDWIAKRKSWRDIPQDYSEDKYDELLARDEQGKLTHTVWEKP